MDNFKGEIAEKFNLKLSPNSSGRSFMLDLPYYETKEGVLISQYEMIGETGFDLTERNLCVAMYKNNSSKKTSVIHVSMTHLMEITKDDFQEIINALMADSN